MAKVFLGLGSNINPNYNIRQALKSLGDAFGELQLSPIYESEAVGFEGDNFLNLVLSLTTDLTVGQLLEHLKDLEAQSGRNPNAPRFSGRTLDIDILLYNDSVGMIEGVTLPREEILSNAFVLKPLSDLAPNTVHPINQKTMIELWQNYDQSKQKLWPVLISD